MVSLIEDDIGNIATNKDGENTASILSRLDDAILKEAGRSGDSRRIRQYKNTNMSCRRHARTGDL